MAMAHSLAVVDDPSFDDHRPPPEQPEHPECPERLFAARRAIARISQETQVLNVPARPAGDDELVRIHTPAYIELLGQAADQWGLFDEDTYAAPGSVNAARRAAGGAVELVNTLMDGHAARGVALLRPPGHHARPGGAMGFCLLNNVAVAAAHARARGAERVLIVDFDVHHGNGTQESFYADPNVLFVSLHQFPLYPGTGSVDEVGEGDGRGRTINVPLSPGADDAVYAAAFERVVAPACADFAPSLVLMSAGFDAHAADPLAQMRLSEVGYAEMVRLLTGALPREVPIGMVLEGGYDLMALEASLVRALQALTSEAPLEFPVGRVDARHAQEIARVAQVLGPYFRL